MNNTLISWGSKQKHEHINLHGNKSLGKMELNLKPIPQYGCHAFFYLHILGRKKARKLSTGMG